MQNDIMHLVNLLRSRKKPVIVQANDGFYTLIIEGKNYGIWTPIGMVGVLDQYVERTYPSKWFQDRGLPISL